MWQYLIYTGQRALHKFEQLAYNFNLEVIELFCKKKIYLNSVSFLSIEMVQADAICRHGSCVSISSYIVITLTADDLVIQGAMASASMTLT